MTKLISNRRKFIQNGVIATGGLMLGASQFSNLMAKPNSEPIRIGVIGTGDRGKGLIQLINEIDGLKVVSCADIIPFRLKEGIRIANIERGVEDYKYLINDSSIDAIIIATPFSTHDEIAIEAMKAGKHVYCEKTMSMGLDNIQSVINTSKNTSLIFQIGHQYHSSPLYNKVREMILSGYIGEVTSFECQWNRNGNWRRPVPDPKWERMINWRMYQEYSGGLVAELMSHQIDFINWVTDSHPAKITGFGGIDHWKDGRETFDNVHLLFEYPSGLDASFTCTTTNAHEDYQIKILGSEATIILDYTKGTIYAEQKGGKATGIVDGVSGATLQAWQKGEGVSIDAPGNDPTMDALIQFKKSISENSPIVSNIQTGANTAKCVHIALDALYNGGIKYWKDYPELDFG